MSHDERQVAYEQKVAALVADWHAPYGEPVTAGNRELMVMNYIRLTLNNRKVHSDLFPEDDAVTQMRRDKAFSLRHEPYTKLYADCSRMLLSLADESERASLDKFAEAWLTASYARLEVGHRLAAALCLTDVPSDMDVRAPWGAWSLVLPPGLLAIRGEPEEMARVWCAGLEPEFVITTAARMIPVERISNKSARAWSLVLKLIRAACLVLSNPDELRKSRRQPIDAAKVGRRSGPPDLLQARYVLGAPVSVDLRQHVADIIAGDPAAKLKTQFLVRGHFRMQAHGPGASLRKKIWVEPFWKGPEDARVLLRQHQVGVAAP